MNFAKVSVWRFAMLATLLASVTIGCGDDDDDDSEPGDDDAADDDVSDDDTEDDDTGDDDTADDDTTDDDTGDDDTADDDTDDDTADDDTADDDTTDDDTGDDDTQIACEDLITPELVEPEVVEIPAGTFTQGSPEEELGHSSLEEQREVTISKAFYMMKYEVTQSLWLAAMGEINPYQVECGDNYPVTVVRWMDAVEFANLLSVEFGYTECYEIGETSATWDTDCTGFRLPTEAEWEYAARAGTDTAFYNGDIVDPGCADEGLLDIAWYCGAGYSAHEVGLKDPNAWGLYDMLGNAWEWAFDGYDAEPYNYDPAGPVTDPVAPGTLARIYRGGSMYAYAANCRAAYRRLALSTYMDEDNGVRLARNKP
ncbi:MAG: formylglycine-generating enzyme family protein [Deltaproteobacteria bacterium]|nr:formylglycine-generating enzyme family protein [Deltaproteobacteria bacterium]